jgi:hypothetical protein
VLNTCHIHPLQNKKARQTASLYALKIASQSAEDKQSDRDDYPNQKQNDGSDNQLRVEPGKLNQAKNATDSDMRCDALSGIELFFLGHILPVEAIWNVLIFILVCHGGAAKGFPFILAPFTAFAYPALPDLLGQRGSTPPAQPKAAPSNRAPIRPYTAACASRPASAAPQGQSFP